MYYETNIKYKQVFTFKGEALGQKIDLHTDTEIPKGGGMQNIVEKQSNAHRY